MRSGGRLCCRVRAVERSAEALRGVSSSVCPYRAFPGVASEFQQQARRILYGILDRSEELHGLTSVDYAVVV